MEESNFSTEFILKKQRISDYLKSRDFSGILLSKRSNYSWLTCGFRNKIMDASEIRDYFPGRLDVL